MTPRAEAAAAVRVQVNVTPLNVRECPTTNCTILARLAKDNVVDAIGRTGASDWVEISFVNTENFTVKGWVSVQYVVAVEGSISQLPVTYGQPANPAAPQPLVCPLATNPTSGAAIWPTNADQASIVFGGESYRWELTAEGMGWHFREEAYRTVLDTHRWPLEGYYDKLPGKDPCQFVAVGVKIPVQGATIWARVSHIDVI